MAIETKQVGVRWPPALWEHMREEAWKRRTSISELTRQAVIEKFGSPPVPDEKDEAIEKP